MAHPPSAAPPRPPPGAGPQHGSAAGDEDDLVAGVFPELDWVAGPQRQNIDRLVDYAEATAKQSADWYFRKRLWKRRFGFFVRIAAMVSLASAGALPIVAQMYQDGSNTFLFQPGTASILIVVAGFFVLLDQFGGFTSGWIRYIQTGQKITNLLEDFRFQDQRLRLVWGETLTEEQVEKHLAICHELVKQVRQHERSETDEWAKEFRAVLADMNQEAQKEPSGGLPGAVEIRLSGGQSLPHGWRVRINDGTALQTQGTHKAVTGLVPGVVKVLVQEVVPGNPQAGRRVEQVATVAAGLSTVVKLHLTAEGIGSGEQPAPAPDAPPDS